MRNEILCRFKTISVLFTMVITFVKGRGQMSCAFKSRLALGGGQGLNPDGRSALPSSTDKIFALSFRTDIFSITTTQNTTHLARHVTETPYCTHDKNLSHN